MSAPKYQSIKNERLPNISQEVILGSVKGGEHSIVITKGFGFCRRPQGCRSNRALAFKTDNMTKKLMIIKMWIFILINGH